jgi:hypothetical protein
LYGKFFFACKNKMFFFLEKLALYIYHLSFEEQRERERKNLMKKEKRFRISFFFLSWIVFDY